MYTTKCSTKTHPQVVGNQKSEVVLENSIKPGKLNKSQLKEFSQSAISEEYAQINFVNFTQKYARRWLGVTDNLQERLYGTATQGGWIDYALSTYKPKKPRVRDRKIIKYESRKGSTPRLVEVRHPESVKVDSNTIYIVEGFKKAVSVAQASGCKTFAFNGLPHGVHLVDAINTRKTEGTKVRVIFDNDNSVHAIDQARDLVKKLAPGISLAKFKDFKGIDDALFAGVKLNHIQWVDSTRWIASYSGYLSGDAYTFSSPRFHEIHVPANKSLVTLVGAKGSGKTYGVEQYCKAHADLVTVNATHRRTLAIANGGRLNIPYIEHAEYKGGSVALCFNRLLKINIDDCVGANFVIDEVVQAVDYLMHSSTLNRERSKIFSHLAKILTKIRETQGKLFVMDADLDRKTIRLLMELGGFTDDDIFAITNTHVFDRNTAYFSRGVQVSDNTSKRHPADLVKLAIDKGLADEHLWICTAAQKAESKYGTICLEQLLIDKGISPNNICRVDAETVGDPTHPAYQAGSKITELSQRFQIILTSPTLATGCDNQDRTFDAIISLQSGSQSTDSARQATERIRDSQPTRYIWAPEKVLWKQESGLVSSNLLDSYRNAHNQALNTFDPSWFADLEDINKNSIIQAVENWYLIDARERSDEIRNYGEKIRQGMVADGYTIEAFESDVDPNELKEIHTALAGISETFVEAKQLQVQEAQLMTDEEYREKLKLEQKTPEDTARIKAHQIRNNLGLEPTIVVQQAVSEGADTHLENQFAALEGYDLHQQLWQREHYYNAGREGAKELTTDFVKRSSKMVKIKALRDVDFFNRILREFSSAEAEQLLLDLRATPLNRVLFKLDNSGKHAVKTLNSIANSFNFAIRPVRRINTGQRFYEAFDKGFELEQANSEPIDVKPQVFEHFIDKARRSVENWQRFKTDFLLIKRGDRLDNTVNLPKLSDEFKYTKLATRARALGQLPKQPNVRQVTAESVVEFKAWLSALPEIAVDIETFGVGKKGGLSHLIGKIRLIQFAVDDAIWYVMNSKFELIYHALREFLINPAQRKIGHNIMFDLRFLRRDFDVLAKNCADTMLGSRCLLGDMGAAQITKHSLQQACENFLGIAIDKTEQTSDWGAEELSESQINYAARDPWLTFLLYKRLEELCKDPSKLLLPFPKMMAWEAWEVENQFLYAAQSMEATGYEIDINALNDVKAQYTTVRDELAAKWDLPFAPTQTQKVRDYLNAKYNLKLTSVGKAAASEHTDKPEIILMQQIKACNMILKQIEAIEVQFARNCGRMQTVFKTMSGTGRTATGAANIDKSILNLQSLSARVNPVLKKFNLPKLKSIFRTQLIIDLPASHGRISAELSNDANHLKGFLDDKIDMHCITAAAVARAVFPDAGYTAEWIQEWKSDIKDELGNVIRKADPIAKGLRDTAKNTYYGWLNGAGVSRIKEQISSNLQIEADPAMCKAALDGLQEVFDKTTAYAKEKLQDIETNQFIVNGIICGWYEFAGTYLCWKLGTVGHDTKVPATKAFAGIWSRTESLLMKKSCTRVVEKFAEMPEWNAKLQNFIHDEINCEIGHPDAAEFAHAVVREEFGKVCYRSVVGFDPLKNCYPLQNWSQKG